MATLGLYDSAGGRVALDVLARAQQWEAAMESSLQQRNGGEK